MQSALAVIHVHHCPDDSCKQRWRIMQTGRQLVTHDCASFLGTPQPRALSKSSSRRATARRNGSGVARAEQKGWAPAEFAEDSLLCGL